METLKCLIELEVSPEGLGDVEFEAKPLQENLGYVVLQPIRLTSCPTSSLSYIGSRHAIMAICFSRFYLS